MYEKTSPPAFPFKEVKWGLLWDYLIIMNCSDFYMDSLEKQKRCPIKIRSSCPPPAPPPAGDIHGITTVN
jgi:hypothetical protein